MQYLGSLSSESLDRAVRTAYRLKPTLPEADLTDVAQEFQLSEERCRKALKQLGDVISTALYHSHMVDADTMKKMWPSKLDEKLKTSLTEIVMKYLKIWRDAATSKRVGMPRFLDVDWRVDVKASSASLAQMSKPTLLLDLKIQDQATSSTVMPGVKSTTMELSKESLATMLSGMHKIRDQLAKLG